MPTTCLDVNKYQLHTNETVKTILRRLEACADPTRLAQMQIDFGFNHCKDNIFLDPYLDLPFVDVVCYDAMHIYMVSGIYCKELHEFLHHLNDHGLGGDSLHAYSQLWTWPKGVATARDLCKPRAGESQAPNGSASEFLSSASVVRKWVEAVVMPRNVLPLACLSMLLLLICVDALMQAQAGLIDPAALEQAILKHLRAHLDAYGDSVWVPKFHFALHLAKLLLKHGCLPTCWVLERKHRVPKRFMQGRTNRVSYSRSVLEEVTVQWLLHELCDPTLRSTMLQSRAASQGMKDILVGRGLATASSEITTSTVIVVAAKHIAKGDVALYNMDGGEGAAHVWFHVSCDSCLMSCIADWPIAEKHST